MEAMGADVSQKIRSAIKAKLIELGAYVDDELPDYIMVMVANKKTKEQMDEDLLLFLGTNTGKFTIWLHEVLERLQSVTSEVVLKKKTQFTSASKSQSSDEIFMRSNKNSKIPENEEVENQDEVLAIKAEFEADDLLSDELQEEDKVNNALLTKTVIQQHVVAPIHRSKVSLHSENTQQSRRGLKRPVPVMVQPIPQKRKSTVGAIVNREVEDDGDDESFPAGALASVVKVSERRSSVPPSLQANRNLIMKAVAEAKKSVLDAAKRKGKVTANRSTTSPVRELFTRKYRNTMGSAPIAAVVLPRKTDEDDLESTMDYVDDKNVDVLPDYVDVDPVMNNDDFISIKRRIVQDNVDERSVSPKFIVTLDGIDPEMFQKKQSYPVLKGTQAAEVNEDADDTSVPMDIEEASSQTTEKNVERCKYWPSCKNGQNCLYHHPSKQCKTFPSCRFGDKCLYIHPNCKYDASCTKQNCPYTHASRRLVGLVLPTGIVKPQVQANKQRETKCRFFPCCTNVNCTFYHPKPCRYGLSCTQVGCTFHHPPLPSREKMKWTCANSGNAVKKC